MQDAMSSTLSGRWRRCMFIFVFLKMVNSQARGCRPSKRSMLRDARTGGATLRVGGPHEGACHPEQQFDLGFDVAPEALRLHILVADLGWGPLSGNPVGC